MGAVLAIIATFIYFNDVNLYLLHGVVISALFYDYYIIINSLKRISILKMLNLLLLITYGVIGTIALSSIYRKDKNICFQLISIVLTSDFFQYVFGSLFGKTKLRIISPNKTYEGYFLGTFATLLIFWPQFNLLFLIKILYWGIFGDLFVSACKRSLELKDTSSLLRSHGGYLDRFDGIYMVSIYYLVMHLAYK
jgi:phosphatidate cytidylyltransferase